MLCFCRTTRVSCEHTYVPSLSRPPAPHPLPPRRHGASGWAPRAVQQLTAASHWRFYTGGGTCQGCSLDLSHSLLPCCVHKTLLLSYRLSSWFGGVHGWVLSPPTRKTDRHTSPHWFSNWRDPCQSLSPCRCSVAQSCPTLHDPMDCSLPRSSVHGISQARVLEWAAVSFSGVCSWPRDWTWVSRTGRWILYYWATKEAPLSPRCN